MECDHHTPLLEVWKEQGRTSSSQLPFYPCLNQALPVSPFLSDMGTGFVGAFRRQKPVMAQRPPAPAWHTEPTPSSTHTARSKAGTTGRTRGGCRAGQELTLLGEGRGTSPRANPQCWHQHRARVRRTHKQGCSREQQLPGNSVLPFFPPENTRY